MAEEKERGVVVPRWAWNAFTLASRSGLVAVAAWAWSLNSDLGDIKRWRTETLPVQQEAQAQQITTLINGVDERSRMNSELVQTLIAELNNVQIQLARLEERNR